MKLYSYVVARDYGFAPNPFFGACTLATCKPKIRGAAAVGDWIVGTGSKAYGLQGKLVYAMRVSHAKSFDEYWSDPLYQKKKPNLSGSLKQAFGDNIYHRNPKTRMWIQANSHHSKADGRPNPLNIQQDCQTPRVLIATEFVYWGGTGPVIPKDFRRKATDVCAHRGHKCKFPGEFVRRFIEWIESCGDSGYCSAPQEWPESESRR